MEKLVYVLWRRGGDSSAGFAGRMRGEVTKHLAEAGVRGLSLNLVDEPAEAVGAMRLTRMDDPLAGLASFWLPAADERDPAEAALRAACGRLAGYLVCESIPLDAPAACGERAPGIDQIALLERPERLSRDEWLRIWLDDHRAVALETQSTFLYVRNVVVRALTPDAPAWEGIVEEGFADDAITDPAKWYRAEGDPEKLARNTSRMVESCKRFLDLARVESHPTSRYPIQERP